MRMNYDELRERAARAVSESGRTQVRLADELDVSPGAMSRALSESGPKFSNLQRRIIEHLTPYRIEQRVVFEAQRAYEPECTKDDSSGEREDAS